MPQSSAPAGQAIQNHMAEVPSGSKASGSGAVGAGAVVLGVEVLNVRMGLHECGVRHAGGNEEREPRKHAHQHDDDEQRVATVVRYPCAPIHQLTASFCAGFGRPAVAKARSGRGLRNYSLSGERCISGKELLYLRAHSH